MKRPSRALARRYARALLDLTREKGRDLPSPEELGEELQAARDLLTSSAELASVLHHPGVSLEKKKQILAAVFKKSKASELFLRLVELLLSRDRLPLLPLVAEVFRELWNAERGVITARAVSALPLEGKQKSALGEALARVSGLGIDLEAEVDPAVLGGVLVRMGGRTYDGTVRARLRALRQRLAGA